MINHSKPIESLSYPLVSVIMLVYNHEAYISEAIESLLSQQCDFPFEVIIAEDCSLDHSRSIIESYASKYPNVIKIISSENNVGMMENLRRAIAACTGKFIAICEGDDYWISKNKISLQVEALNKKTDLDVCITRGYKENSQVERYIQWDFGEISREISTNEILNRPGIVAPTASFMFRTRSISNMPEWFYKAPVGDIFLLMAAMRDKGVYYIPECTCVYREFLPESWTTNFQKINKKTHIIYRQELLKSYEKAIFDFSIPHKMLKKRLNVTRWILFKDSCNSNQALSAIRYLYNIEIIFLVNELIKKITHKFLKKIS